MTKDEFIARLNRERLAGGWYMGEAEVEEKEVLYKGFGTWIQRLQINGVDHSGPMDMLVQDWKAWLQERV